MNILKLVKVSNTKEKVELNNDNFLFGKDETLQPKFAKIFGLNYSVNIYYLKITSPELNLEKNCINIHLPISYRKKNNQELINIILLKMYTKIAESEIENIMEKARHEFDFAPEYGEDLAKEHEKYLTEEKFHSPVFVYDWPKDIKAFYMRLNDDNETVAAVDLLVPGSGELMGGSQREERLDVLLGRMKEMGVSEIELDWYVNLRKFGGCEHAGFGMGFERLLIYLTGVDNIRDVIPFPRTPGNCLY